MIKNERIKRQKSWMNLNHFFVIKFPNIHSNFSNIVSYFLFSYFFLFEENCFVMLNGFSSHFKKNGIFAIICNPWTIEWKIIENKRQTIIQSDNGTHKTIQSPTSSLNLWSFIQQFSLSSFTLFKMKLHLKFYQIIQNSKH